MRKIVSRFILFFVLGMIMTGCSAASIADQDLQTEARKITMQIDNPIMTIDGVDQEIDEGHGTTPVIRENRTLLPIRAVAQAMGASVTWEEETQTTALAKGDTVILLTIGSNIAYRNQEKQTLDTQPMLLNDRTMLPVRFIAESFGYDVEWNEADQTITLTKNNAAPVGVPTDKAADTGETDMVSKSIVVYFSQTGRTKPFADNIAEITNSDRYEIKAAVPYTDDDINYNNNNSRANREQNDESARPEIAGDTIDLSQYDTIYLGYPIWWGTIPRIINTFIDTYDLSGKTIMPFCTSHSTGISVSVADIRRYCPNSEVKDGLRGTEQTTEAEIKQWIEEQGVLLAAAENAISITVANSGNVRTFTATLEDNSSAKAFAELLRKGPVTVEMRDYGSFEKVGALGATLPKNDEQITTQAGDLILYQGNQITIYYDTNSWNFTRLGRIDAVTQDELKDILGEGTVTVTFALLDR